MKPRLFSLATHADGKKQSEGKGGGGATGANASKATPHLQSEEEEDGSNGYAPMSIEDLRSNLRTIRRRVPSVPEGGFLVNSSDDESGEEVADFAREIDGILDELEFVMVLLDVSAYEWDSKRSGAASQNYGLLCGELMKAISCLKGLATTNCLGVLVPGEQLVKDKTVITKDEGTGEETRKEHWMYKKSDPKQYEYQKAWVCRQAPLVREVFLATFHKLDRIIGDYLEAKTKDGQHGSSMAGFGY